MVKYKYDAWGNHAVLNPDGSENENSTFIGNVNPFRYRGYYYDTETGLYYLKSRYYDPETGRFITIDDVSYLAPDTINGLNLYAYCGNNPVMNVDPNGTFILSLLASLAIAALVGSAVGVVGQFVSDMITSIITGQFQLSSWETYLGAAVGGAVGGMLTFIGAPPSLVGFVTGFTTTFVGMGLEMATGRREQNWGELWLNSFVDGGFGALFGALSGSLSFANSWNNSFQKALQNLAQYGSRELLPLFAQLSSQTLLKGFIGQVISGIGMDLYYGIKPFFIQKLRRG